MNKNKQRKGRRPSVPIIDRNGVLFVRATHQGQRKERRLYDPAQAAEIYVALKRELEQKQERIEQQLYGFTPSISTVGDLLDYYTTSYKPIDRWYQAPIRETVVAYRNPKGRVEQVKLAEVPLTVLESGSGYDVLASFKRAREAVFNQRFTRIPDLHPRTKKAVTRREYTTRKPATINREMEILRRLINYAHKRGWLTKNPFYFGPSLIPKSEEEKRDRIPTPQEEQAILDQCIGNRQHLHGILITAVETGLRRKWLLKLRWTMIDFEDGVINLTSLQKEQKRNKRFPRYLGMTGRLRVELQRLQAEWLAECVNNPQRDDRLFPVTEFKHSYTTACRLAGVEDLHFHDWRHKFATNAITAGVPKALAMKMVGHTNEETFDIYLNIDMQIAQQFAQQMDSARRAAEQG